MNTIDPPKELNLYQHIHFISPINSGCIALGMAIFFVGNDVWMLSIISFIGLLVGGIMGPMIFKYYQKKIRNQMTVSINKFGVTATIMDFFRIFFPSLFCTILPAIIITIAHIPWIGLAIQSLLFSLLIALLFSFCLSLIFSIFPIGSHAK